MAKLTDMLIAKDIAVALADLGIGDTDALLAAAGGKDDRKEFCKANGIDESALLAALNRADLARIKGIRGKYSNLLEIAGVDTVPELAQRNAANLHATLVVANAEHNLVDRMPTTSDIESWVTQAKELDRAIHY